MTPNLASHDRPRRTEPLERRLCASPICSNTFVEPADETGLCERCALEAELFDRELRWARVFPAERSAN